MILSEVEGDQGKAKIVYRPGGEVDVGELASLCEKVGWPKRPADKVAGALKNSFLVRRAAFNLAAGIVQECTEAWLVLGHVPIIHVT